MGDEQLVPRFVQAYYACQATLDSKDKAAATKAYQQLLAVYKELAASSLEKPHKELAHQQIQTVYQGLTSLPTVPQPAPVIPPATAMPSMPNRQSFFAGFGAKDFITIGFFALLIVAVLFFKPEYIGLASFETDNKAPLWLGTQTDYPVAAGSTLALELASSFHDTEGDALVYLATDTPGLQVSVTGSVVTIRALEGAFGSHAIVLMASDLRSVTKVPITVRVV